MTVGHVGAACRGSDTIGTARDARSGRDVRSRSRRDVGDATRGNDVPADARTRHHHYYGRTYYRHKVCRRSSATTGTVVGGVAGAVAGPSIIGHGLLGAAAGAVGGAVAGGAIDRSMTARRRCYYR